MPISTITIAQPFDAHLHLRDGAQMANVVPHSAGQFSGGIIMPNLKVPITTFIQARDYQKRIKEALPAGSTFEPYMTLYLTDRTTPSEITVAAHHHDIIKAVKLYPAGATTNSDLGVTSLSEVRATLDMLEREGIPLGVHGEVVDPSVDVFDREKAFIDRELIPLTRYNPGLHIVFEHVTTKQAVQFVQVTPNMAATITAHHLLLNRNALFKGGIRSHHYCLPVLKREEHRQALLRAATSGNEKFFLGTDSAPHGRRNKETSCGCAGCFTAPGALGFYIKAFEEHDPEALCDGRFEKFASFNGPDFYRIERSKKLITLERSPWKIPDTYEFGGDVVVPFGAFRETGEMLEWKVKK